MKIEDKEYLRAAKKIWCGDEYTIQNVMCRNCKHIKNFDYIYDDTMGEVEVYGECGNKKSEHFNFRVEPDIDNCKHYDT